MAIQKSKPSAFVKAAILTMSFVQMGTNGIAPILAQIAAALHCSDATVQFLMTFPSIFCVVFTLLSALMAERLPKKTLAVCGLTFVTAAGVLAFLFHGSIQILYVWAALLGSGIGMVAPIAPSLVAELFCGEEQATLMGQQNSAASVGGMLMTFFGGFLATLGWQFGYLVYLLALPGLFLTLKAVPATSSPSATQKTSSTKFTFPSIQRELVLAVCFMILFNCAPTNLSMLVLEKSVGDSSLAGILTTLFLLGGVLSGLCYGTLAQRFAGHTIRLGSLCLTLGYLLLGFFSTPIPMAVGCLLAGGSIGLFMPTCMMAASRQQGQETLSTALILAFSNIGVFVAPLLTTLTTLLVKSNAITPRFLVAAVLAVVLSFF